MNGEPSLDQIDDYNNNESPEKRRTIWMVIIGLIVVGIIYSAIKISFDSVDDYTGTPQNPGINTAKTY